MRERGFLRTRRTRPVRTALWLIGCLIVALIIAEVVVHAVDDRRHLLYRRAGIRT
jgi:hypothetical protein